MSVVLPIVVRFGSTDEVEVAGPASALRVLATVIRSELPISVQLSSGEDPFPYSTFGLSIEVGPGDGKVRIVRREDVLVVTGDLKSRAILAANLDDFAKSDKLGSHLHIEYFPGHSYLAQDSVPVVISADSGQL